jgi:hypothetical protein
MSNRITKKITISSYSGEIIRQPPKTNGLASVYPLYYKQADQKTGYFLAKSKYKPLLAAARAKEITQANVDANYRTRFNDGWKSADFMVEQPALSAQKRFFNKLEDVASHIYPNNMPERRPWKGGTHQPVRQHLNTIQQQQLTFREPSKEINTQNGEKFIIHRRIYNYSNDHSPRTGIRFNPRLLNP